MLQDSVLCEEQRVSSDGNDGDDEDSFSHSSQDDDLLPFTEPTSERVSADLDALSVARARAVCEFFEELEIAAKQRLQMPFPETRIFLGHGSEDEKVPLERGYEARECLRSLGADLTWKEYQNLGHWYSGEMLTGLVQFPQHKTGW